MKDILKNKRPSPSVKEESGYLIGSSKTNNNCMVMLNKYIKTPSAALAKDAKLYSKHWLVYYFILWKHYVF